MQQGDATIDNLALANPLFPNTLPIQRGSQRCGSGGVVKKLGKYTLG